MSIRILCTICGVGLLAVSLFGFLTGGRHPLLLLDLAVGIAVLSLAAAMNRKATSTIWVGGPAILSVALFAFWLGGILGGAPAWLVWWTFGFSFTLFMVALQSGARREWEWVGTPPHSTVTKKTDSERPQQVA